ncbi:hypothetical protein AX16_010260 [Volvariella volvacea WC 439]|nr:hypothetical protein AX16_010260 [Volvariella volvacea WC 439]
MIDRKELVGARCVAGQAITNCAISQESKAFFLLIHLAQLIAQLSLKLFKHTNMPTRQFIEEHIEFVKNYLPPQEFDDDEVPTGSPITTTPAHSSLGFGGDAPSSATSYAFDPHTVSHEEAHSYYAGLPSEPILLYRTGKKWSPPMGPEAQRRRKQLVEVFEGKVADLWNDGVLSREAVKVMEAHGVLFTSMDVVRFKTLPVDKASSDDEESAVSPVTIWIGVLPGSTLATAAHNAAKDVQGLLEKYGITDEVNIEFRESDYQHHIGAPLYRSVNDLNPLVDVVGPLTPALGLRISTTTRPTAQGNIALYLAEGGGSEGGGSDELLGLTCRHVLIGPKEDKKLYAYHTSQPPKDVILLGHNAYTNLIDSIKLKIGELGITAQYWEEQIEDFKQREDDADPEDAAAASVDRAKTETLLAGAMEAMDRLEGFRVEVEREWSNHKSRVLGPVLRSPPIALGVGEHRFTEDWGIFEVDRAKLGEGFQGNRIDLGTKIPPATFTRMCFPHPQANWKFKYPRDRMLKLHGTISHQLMRSPDMKNQAGEPCLLVVKSGNATGTTLGRANGVFSVVRKYSIANRVVEGTSMEWVILCYDHRSGVFSERGDSGSVVVDIRGQVGGMITGGAGKTDSTDMTYATPFWWLLERIRGNKFPNVHISVV